MEMTNKLTSEALAEWLGLLPTITDLANETGICRERLKNLRLGRVKSLTTEELESVHAALAARGFSRPNAKALPQAGRK